MHISKNMQFGVISTMPNSFQSWLTSGVIQKAFAKKILLWDCINPRDFVTDNYKSIDDSPYGGGPGMVMKAEPLMQALQALQTKMPSAKVHVLAPEGKKFDNRAIHTWLKKPQHILICGRYEGIDARFIHKVQPQLWSIGDYVLCGGELAAMVIIESIARYIPGVLGNCHSLYEDSFYNQQKYQHKLGLLDNDHYTRPATIFDMPTPPILQSGNHKNIDAWRAQSKFMKTWLYRPELLRGELPHPQEESIKKYYLQRLQKYFEKNKKK